MAGHAQLKFVMTECSKTQIRLTRLNCKQTMLCYSIIMCGFVTLEAKSIAKYYAGSPRGRVVKDASL